MKARHAAKSGDHRGVVAAPAEHDAVVRALVAVSGTDLGALHRLMRTSVERTSLRWAERQPCREPVPRRRERVRLEPRRA